MLAAFAGMSFAGTGYAADQTEAHALADTVVTAQRREKRDLDTPATTTLLRMLTRVTLSIQSPLMVNR